ncbi:hypothetical protein ACTXLW_01355 [Psychrobacter celer]|uniref:hypothetical protein n=1 Tax=Psychrobacter celer TaxID=306572 RepID=UPI003FD0DD9A
MFKAAIKTTAYKQPVHTALSALLLLSVVSLASAQDSIANNTAQIVDANSAVDCRDDIQAQATSYKYQSTQQRVLNCMVEQLQPYQQKDKTAHQQYLAYKAQAWLNYAIHQDSINSRSTAGAYAAQTAESILQSLKNGTEKDISLYQDTPAMSALMRPDLWATISALKDSGGIESAPREIAFSEVALIWAATNQCERGWRESGMHFRMADRWLEQAREAYINAHDAQTNVALEQSIVNYYNQYAPLDASDDVCRGQVLTPSP